MKKALFIALLFPFWAFASFDTNLQYGSRGVAVSELQEFLTIQGFYTGPITGNFFSLTREAVKKFQKAHNLYSAGYFGVLTRGVANSLLLPQLEEEQVQMIQESGTITPTPTLGSEPIFINPIPQEVMPEDLSDIVFKKLTKPTPDEPFLYFEADLKGADGKLVNKPAINILLTKDGVKLDEVNTGEGYTRFSRETPDDIFGIVYSKTLIEKGSYALTLTANGITKTEVFEVK